ncbi:MAG: hypothetical protein S4CHLAM20_15500 [Chlamydiia bacterium]|nr:hypothetical protein [Chlamydiia bacterium]
MIYLFCLCFISLFAEVTLIQNPAQQFNSSDNFANRVVYFFVEKATDGSVTLQLQPPPFYPFDQNYINAGFAYIDSDKVVKTYTKDEVANLKNVDISFTVKAFANTQSANGYNFYATAYQWFFNLDQRSDHYYQLQQFNNAYGTNPSIGGHALYSDVLNMKHWVSTSDGVFLTTSDIDNVLVQVNKAATNTSYTFTVRIDLSQLTAAPSRTDPSVLVEAPPGIYSLFFFFEMQALDLNQPFEDTLTNYASIQTTQMNYLYNNVIWMDGMLDGSSALYDPSIADQVIIRVNRASIISQYNRTLAAITTQWNGYAELPNLSTQSSSLINDMLATIATYEANKANF